MNDIVLMLCKCEIECSLETNVNLKNAVNRTKLSSKDKNAILKELDSDIDKYIIMLNSLNKD